MMDETDEIRREADEHKQTSDERAKLVANLEVQLEGAEREQAPRGAPPPGVHARPRSHHIRSDRRMPSPA